MLNQQQKLFCKFYMESKDFDVGDSYQRAYPDCKTKRVAQSAGNRLLQTVDVKAELSRLSAKIISEEEVIITVNNVLASLKDTRDRCMQAKPVLIKDDEGKWIESGEWQFNAQGANKANELLGKYLAMFTEKMQIDGRMTFEDYILQKKGQDLEQRKN